MAGHGAEDEGGSRSRRRGRRAFAAALALLVALASLVAACGEDARESRSGLSSSAPAGGVPGVVSSEDAATSGGAGTTLAERAQAPAAPANGAAGKDAGAPSALVPDGGVDGQVAAQLLGRKIVRQGTLDLEVTSVVEAYDRVTAIASSAGGYVGEASFLGSGDTRSARLVLRVPADRYDRTVAELRALAKDVKSIALSSNDATAEYTDLESTLRHLRGVETQYLQLLNRATTIPDILQLQDRLRQVRLEIDRIQGRVAAIDRLSELATVTVQLSPVPVLPKPEPKATRPDNPLEAARAAWDASLDTLREIGTVLTAVVVYSWWLLPFAAAAAILARRALASRRRAPVAALPSPQP
jgi:hypothetical protein